MNQNDLLFPELLCHITIPDPTILKRLVAITNYLHSLCKQETTSGANRIFNFNNPHLPTLLLECAFCPFPLFCRFVLELSLTSLSSFVLHLPNLHEFAQRIKLRRVQCLRQQVREHQLGPDVARDDDAAPSEVAEKLVADVHVLPLPR